MRSVTGLSAAVLILTLLSVCSSTETAQKHSFRIEEADGVETALTLGGPRYSGELFSYEELLVIRSDPEHEDTFFDSPYAPIVDDEGCVFVLDGNNNVIVVLDSEGRYMRSIGRRGYGPGEFNYPFHMTLSGDTLTVTQFDPWRLIRFHTDGRFLDTVSFQPSRASSYVPYLHLLPDGTMVITRSEDDRTEKYIRRRGIVEVMTADGDTVAVLATPFVTEYERRAVSLPDRRYMHPLPIQFGGGPICVFDAHRNRILMTTGEEPEIKVYSLDGQLKRIIRIDLPYESVSSQEIALIRDHYNRELAAVEQNSPPGSQSLIMTRHLRDNIICADTKAFWEWLYVDAYGYIWLRYAVSGVRDYELNFTSRYRILSPEGEYLGDTTTPLLYIGSPDRGNFLTLVLDEETGEEIPTVFSLLPAIPGFSYP